MVRAELGLPAGRLLSARGLSKAYRRRAVLCGVDLDVDAGELVGVEGENGAGKSTLLECLVGLGGADVGQVRVSGRLGYCPQRPVLMPLLTAREFLALIGNACGLARRTTAERTAALAERYDCGRFLDTRIDQMSGGTAQKVNLMAALLDEPDVLLLDEPYQGFDYGTYQAFWSHAAQLRDDGRAVIVVSHMHLEAGRFDRMLVLRDGVIEERAS